MAQNMICSTAVLLLLTTVIAANGDLLYDKFADDFMWSTSTSAYQIEGGWDLDGRYMAIVISI